MARSDMKVASLFAFTLVFAASASLWAQVNPVPIKQKGAGSLIEERGDVNADGKPDVWNYVEAPTDGTSGEVKRHLAKKEADLDFNGSKDIIRMYDADGVLTQEEADLDFDGYIDQRNYYTDGTIREKRFYKNRTKNVFIWKFYKDGKLTQLHRDDDGDGKVDYCELWFAGEKLNKRGWDKSGDGECDYWETAD